MNQLHGRFDIANEDFLYVLSTFIFEPIRWNDRFGWRPLSDKERLGYVPLLAARSAGGWASATSPPTSTPSNAYNRDYERRRFRYTEANHRVGAATVEVFASWFPGLSWLRP